MAMRKDQIPDNKFTLPLDARELALYTRQITKNAKVFDLEIDASLPGQLRATADRIFFDIFGANDLRQHGADGYVLLVDIRHYYDTMPHDVANRCFERHLPPSVHNRVREVLDRQYTGEAGYNPGSQMVQLAGISVPDPIDHYIKERLRAKKYVRFMDDSLIIHHDKARLEEWREAIRARYAADGMELHPTKTKIVRLKDGFRFLGFIYRLTPAGKVVMTVDPQNVKAERKRLFRLAQLIKAGEKPASALYEQYGSWKAHAAKGNSQQLLQRMDQYVKTLLEGITT